MESRSYNFSTARKRSTLLEAKSLYFAKDEDSAPRARILVKECPDEYVAFKDCMKEKNDEAKCGNFKDTLNECAGPAFRKANTTSGYKY